MADKILSMGPCEIKFTPYKDDGTLDVLNVANIDITLKDSDTLLTLTQETYEVMVDQVPGAYIQNIIAGEATFACTVFLDVSKLPKLTNAFKTDGDVTYYSTYGVSPKYGQLEIHPLSAGTNTDSDITVFKSMCSVNVNGSYKEEGELSAELMFSLMANTMVDKTDSKYGMLLQIGKETP